MRAEPLFYSRKLTALALMDESGVSLQKLAKIVRMC